MTSFSQHFAPQDLLDRLPHRYENILLDSVDYTKSDTEISGALSLTIPSDGSDPRAIFLEEFIPGQFSIIPTALMEILALASIVCTDYDRENLIIFASMSNFACHRPALSDGRLLGKVVKLRDKGNFLRCRGDLVDTKNNLIASGELMAFIISEDQLAQAAPTAKIVDIPTNSLTIDVDKTQFKKQNSMVVCDQLLHVDMNAGMIVSQYQYPMDHPFTRGHFPGNPIMMGIMQLLGVEDAISAAALNGLTSAGTFTGDAEVIRNDGTLIAEIKGFEVHAKSPLTVTLSATKKVIFRDPVKPGDTLLLRLFNLVQA
jgi:3-hydroxymyristoyl/3-hydroxydecanoyl-(acyl carrier protein) dehydratase